MMCCFTSTEIVWNPLRFFSNVIRNTSHNRPDKQFETVQIAIQGGYFSRSRLRVLGDILAVQSSRPSVSNGQFRYFITGEGPSDRSTGISCYVTKGFKPVCKFWGYWRNGRHFWVRCIQSYKLGICEGGNEIPPGNAMPLEYNIAYVNSGKWNWSFAL